MVPSARMQSIKSIQQTAFISRLSPNSRAGASLLTVDAKTDVASPLWTTGRESPQSEHDRVRPAYFKVKRLALPHNRQQIANDLILDHPREFLHCTVNQFPRHG